MTAAWFVSKVEQVVGALALLAGYFLGLSYLLLTFLDIGGGIHVFVWQFPVVGAVVLAGTVALTRAMLLRLPVWRWLFLQFSAGALALVLLFATAR